MKRIQIIVSIFILAWASAARADSSGNATRAIREANSRLRELLGSHAEDAPAKVTRELRQLFDIGDLARRALVDHWGAMSAAQRHELVETLRLIVERNYVSQLRTNLDYEIAYLGETKQGEDLVVQTVIKTQRKGRPVEIPVDYVLHADRGSFRVYDVITDEVSLLKNYRSQFNRIIAKEGPDGLIRRMKNRLGRQDD